MAVESDGPGRMDPELPEHLLRVGGGLLRMEHLTLRLRQPRKERDFVR